MDRRLLLFCFLLSIALQIKAADDMPVIAVAANFAPALQEIANRFTADTGHPVKISTGASGTLVRQIEQGAPYELFFSADEKHVEILHEKGLAPDSGWIYAVGRLVLYIPHTSRLDKMHDIQNILRQLVADSYYRLAIANPELAPYGRAARQVLNRFTTSHMLKDRMIIGENAGQTAQFALTGSVDAAFLPYSLAIAKKMQDAGHFELIPGDWYNPVNQRVALLKNAGQVARALYDYLSSEPAQRIIVKFGYAPPAH